MTDKQKIIETSKISRLFFAGTENQVNALVNVSINIDREDFVSLVGVSGSGKSTFMNILGLLDSPDAGVYYLNGIDTTSLTENKKAAIRTEQIGFVFQNFNLIPRLNALENVMVPLFYAKRPLKERKEIAKEVLCLVGMYDRANHLPHEMSGGQCQRVAIARAIANNPEIILADEPTGALDSKTSRVVMDLFHRLHEEYKKTIILVTHNVDLANETNRKIVLADGIVVNDVEVK